MPPKLAMPPAMAPSGQGSRTDPKPLLRASKEWVVPPRPKPGRKSTKSEAEQAKATGRTSQKAFRERRQEYVTELEEKVRQLEAGEGEKCVFYQQQAQKAKLETSALKTENDGLKKIIDQLRRELDLARGKGLVGGKDKGKGRAMPVEFEEAASPGPSKRPRRSAAVRAQAVVASASGSSPLPIPSAESPLPVLSPPSTTASSTTSSFVQSPLNDIHPVGPASPAHVNGRCGFCASNADCFCADVGYQIVSTPGAAAVSGMPFVSPVIKIEEQEDMFFGEQTYEPAVPLRLRKSQTKAAPIWAIQSTTTVTTTSTKPALCNGDPSNCPACSDDPFGKAFCNALSSTVCSTTPCANCPGNCSSRKMPTPPPEETDEETALFESLTDLPCCGDPSLCGSLTCKPSNETVKEEPKEVEMLPRTVSAGVRSVETVPCNEAWTALKAHPNIAFADLAMLADVVAKRTHCGGPVHSTPPPVPSTSAPDSSFDPSRQLVPQSQLQCSIDAGTRKRLTVERGAVNEALEILDRAVARGH
ncbi:hypothetical protein JCM8547_004890 [Rhodosporidiobolus lusitaniae]